MVGILLIIYTHIIKDWKVLCINNYSFRAVVLRGDAFSSIFFSDAFVKIFQKISTKDYKCVKFIKGAFLSAGSAFMELARP